MRKVGFVCCAKQKQTYSCTAEEMCAPLMLFRRAITYSKAHYDETYIISAKHGLLKLTDIVDPLEEFMKSLTPMQKSFGGGLRILGQLKFWEKLFKIYIHAGREYREDLELVLREAGIPVEVPLSGL